MFAFSKGHQNMLEISKKKERPCCYSYGIIILKFCIVLVVHSHQT